MYTSGKGGDIFYPSTPPRYTLREILNPAVDRGSNAVLKTIGTMRSVREFKHDTLVDDDKLRLILEAGLKAASGGNSQPWAFVVIRDVKRKGEIGQIVAREWHRMMDVTISEMPLKRRRLYDSATRLVDHTADVPIVILGCLDLSKTGSGPLIGASIYPAVQNMMLAAWSLGLGTCLTTHGCSDDRGEQEVKRLLGIQANIKICAFVYLGVPARSLSPPRRREIAEVVHYEVW